MNPPLFPNQQEALERFASQSAGMLAFPMGLGKTRTIIELMREWSPTRTLVVAPKKVCPVWVTEIGKYYPEISPQICLINEGTMQARLKKIQKSPHASVWVVNYESIWRQPLATWIKANYWNLIICDESHKIQSAGSSVSMFMGRMANQAQRRFCLTGTPMGQDPSSIYGQFRFMDKTVFGTSAASFRARYLKMGGFENRKVLGLLDHMKGEFMEKVFSRAMYCDENLIGLPELIESQVECDLGIDGRRIYTEMKNELVALIQGGTASAAITLTKALRLQQITGGTLRRDEDRVEVVVDTSKRELLEELLGDVDEPVVVFARFTSDLRAIKLAAENSGYEYFELSGKADTLAAWQAGNNSKQLIGVQIQSGSAGIDLTRASLGIYYSCGESLINWRQSRKRLHRPGQTKCVRLIKLIAKKTIDRKVYRDIENGVELIDSLLTWSGEEE